MPIHTINAFSYGYFQVILAYAVIGLVISIIFWLVHKHSGHHLMASEAFLIASLGMIGGLTGYLGGASREAAVGDILPAVLSFFAGLSIFFFGNEKAKKTLTAMAMFSFGVSLFLGFAYGADVRSAEEYNADFRKACISLILNPQSYVNENALSARLNNEEDKLVKSCKYFMG